jgi:4-hydroxy-tetrahydrodipicolinate reductase
MKIALIGYGKMGQAIEQIAVGRGHEIVLKVSIDNLEDNTIEKISNADVAIEFTGPESALENVIRCIDAGVPVVCGSTGWLPDFEKAVTHVREKKGALLYASNFSIGVNIFFEINRRLAQLMKDHSEYRVAIHEVHHTQKKDAPSGTAISLAEQVVAENNRMKKWVAGQTRSQDEVAITSERTDPAPGTHYVKYTSAVDDIEIIHTAHNRTGFASGAVRAAEFIQGKAGVYSMKDVLSIG